MLTFFDRASLDRGNFSSFIGALKTPIQFKIGIDAGQTLCKLAVAVPSETFVGIEIKTQQAKHAYGRAKALRLDNVIVINDEAAFFLANHCPSSIFSKVHIYFPTPYLSALQKVDRSLAHLLLVRRFVDELYRVVMPGGAVRIATDVGEYYRAIERLFDFSRWMNVHWSQLNIEKPANCFVGTPCELECRRAGKDIFAVELLRI